MQINTVLVTGGSGFIGSHYCAEAIRRGLRVFVLTRNTAGCRHLPAGVTLVSSLDQLPDIPFDMVLNLAGEPLFKGRWSKRKKQLFYESRIGTTKALFSFFQAKGQFPRLLISGSAVGYYGPHAGEHLDEQSGTKDSFGARLCEDWEKSALLFEPPGTRVCLLRTGLVMGKDGGMLKPLLPLYRSGLGGRLGDGKQWMSWIHIDDLVGIIFHLMQCADINGGINATAPNPVTNREFNDTLAKSLNRPAFFHLPGFLLKALLGEMGEEMLVSQRVLPKKILEGGYRFRFQTLRSAFENLFDS